MEYLNLSQLRFILSVKSQDFVFFRARKRENFLFDLPPLPPQKASDSSRSIAPPNLVRATTILPDNSWADFFYALSSFTSHPHLVHPYPLAPRRFHKMHADPVTVERGKNRVVERCVNLGKSWFERRFFTCRFGIEVWNEGIREELCNY